MPSDSVNWDVRGLKELDARLLGLPIKLQAKALRGAVSAGARVIRDDARSRIHDAPHWDKDASQRSSGGALRDAIRFTTSVSTKNGTVGARVFVSKKKAWYGRLVHFGTLPHLIFGAGANRLNRQVRTAVFGDNHKKANRFQVRTAEKKLKALNILGHFVEKVNHPGAKPQPFLEEAAAAKSEAAVDAMAQKLRDFFNTAPNF